MPANNSHIFLKIQIFKSNTLRSNFYSSSFLGGATVSMRVEIFKLSCRPPAFVISSVFNWLGVFVIGTTFPFIVVSDLPQGAPQACHAPELAMGVGRRAAGDVPRMWQTKRYAHLALFLTLLFPAGRTQALLFPHLYGRTFHFSNNFPSVPSRNKREVDCGNNRRV